MSSVEFLKSSIFCGPILAGTKLPIAKRIRGTENILVGYSHKKGCFSARLLGDVVEVALYPHLTPQEVAMYLARSGLDAEYFDLPYTPGWGFKALHLLKADMEAAIDC